MSKYDGGRALRSVEDTPDGVEQRRGCIEASCDRVGEPLPELLEEAGHAMTGMPLAGWIQVDAEPLALEHVSVPEEPEVIDGRAWRLDREGRAESNDHVLGRVHR